MRLSQAALVSSALATDDLPMESSHVIESDGIGSDCLMRLKTLAPKNSTKTEKSSKRDRGQTRGGEKNMQSEPSEICSF